MKITLQDSTGETFVLLDSDSANHFECDFCEREVPCFSLREPNACICPKCIIKALESARLLDAP